MDSDRSEREGSVFILPREMAFARYVNNHSNLHARQSSVDLDVDNDIQSRWALDILDLLEICFSFGCIVSSFERDANRV